jgi:penicillin-binding protein 1A
MPAHGDYCDDFPAPTEPFQSSPFFGHYSRTGGSTSTSSSGYYYDPSGTTGGTTPSTGTGGTGYDPNLYESAPQQQPNVQVPPAQEELAPAPTEGGGQAAPGDG